MKIGIVNKGAYTAIEHYRQELPHAYLNTIGVECETLVSNEADLKEFTDEQLKKYQAIQFSRVISKYANEQDVIDRLHGLGIKVIFDIDDYWHLPDYHYLYKAFEENKVPQKIERTIKAVDLVTVSTNALYKIAKELNDNTHVIKNSIPEDLVNVREIKSNRVRFGYVAGVYHLKDARVLYEAVQNLYKNRVNYNLFQFVLCGFNVQSMEYLTLETYLTGGYAFKQTERNYIEYLSKMTMEGEHIANNKPYKRIWSLPVREYLDCLNNFDVAIAPLYDDAFTRCKSQLKAIEAGMFGKGFICSPCEPYSEFIDNKHCLKASTSSQWYLAFRRLIFNKNLLKDLQSNLSEYVKENFNFVKIQNERKEIYQANK